MTEMFGEAWSPMSVPDLAPDDDDDLTAYGANVSPRFYRVSVVAVITSWSQGD